MKIVAVATRSTASPRLSWRGEGERKKDIGCPLLTSKRGMTGDETFLLEPVDETNSPARIDWRPVELSLRLCVRAAADLSHYGHAGLANRELSQPVGNSERWLCLDGLGKCRQPYRDLGGIIVDDVVDAR